MDNSTYQINVLSMNLISIKLHMENIRSISVYIEGRAMRGQILKIFVPDLINSDLWFHILKLFYQINLSPQRKLVML